MKNLCGLIILPLLFFTTRSFGGNKPLRGGPVAFASDTAKKTVTADTAKKAADDTTDNDDNSRSYAIGLMYGSDQNYHGIHSASKLPYIEPNFTYTAPSGFYVLASAQDILVKKVGGFDAFDINPGWDIDLADNTTLNGNISHYIFRGGTPEIIRSDLSNAIETYIDQSVGETEGRFTIGYDYYKKTSLAKTPGDIILTPDIQHTFDITLSKKSTLSLIPEGSISFGTRNAYTHYEVNAGDTVHSKSGKPKQIPNNSSFGTLDYTLVFTIDYKIGNFEFEPALNYTRSLYNPTGVPTSALKYLTIALVYTIE